MEDIEISQDNDKEENGLLEYKNRRINVIML